MLIVDVLTNGGANFADILAEETGQDAINKDINRCLPKVKTYRKIAVDDNSHSYSVYHHQGQYQTQTFSITRLKKVVVSLSCTKRFVTLYGDS